MEKSENTLPPVLWFAFPPTPDVVVRGFWTVGMHSIHLMIQIFTIYIVGYKKIYITIT